jgi:hypothetical protein
VRDSVETKMTRAERALVEDHRRTQPDQPRGGQADEATPTEPNRRSRPRWARKPEG